MLVKIWAFLVLVQLSPPIVGSASAGFFGPDRPEISLAGAHKFKVGDNVSWANPDFEDSDWQNVTVPGLWSDLSVDRTAQVGWYRIRFTYAANLHLPRPAFASYLLHQDEVYLNGQKIGGFGKFAIFGKAPRPDVPHGRFRVYSIPPELINKGGENIISIRLNRQAVVDEGGIPAVFTGIVDYQAASSYQSDRAKLHWLVDGALFGMNLFIACLMLVLVWLGLRARAIVTLGVLISALLLNNLSESHFIFDAQIFSPSLREFRNAMTAVATVMLIEFSSAVLRVPLGRVGRGIQLLIVLGLTPHCLIFGALDDTVIAWSKRLLLLSLLLGALWIFYSSIIAIRHRRRTGWFMLIGYGMTIAAPSIVSLLSQGALLELSLLFGRWPHNVSTQIFMFSLSGLMAYQLHQTEMQRVLADQRALHAQQDERRRVSRDMHDSIGQWLSAIKLKLDRMLQFQVPADQNSLRELVGEVDVLIDDTRRISHDLSPSFIMHGGLEKALRDHFDLLEEEYGVTAQLQIAQRIDLADEYADHLYRIVQEASRNSVEHGGASRLLVQIAATPTADMTMLFEDDGIGFDPKAKDTEFSLGLRNLHERAGILGLELTINSRRGEGVRLSFNPRDAAFNSSS